MAEYPYLNFYPADYMGDGDVQLCTTAQEGIYMRLLCFAWLEGSLPRDVEQVLLICKRDARKQDVQHVMDTFFSLDGDRLINIRLEVERQMAAARTERASAAGRASGKKRELKRQLKSNVRSNRVDENEGFSPTQTELSKAKAKEPPNPLEGGFNFGRRKRDQFPPLPDRTAASVKAWIKTVERIPRDPVTVGKIVAAAERIADESELFFEIDRIARGQA